MFIVAAGGAKPDDRFEEMFLPGYDPNREMTEDEIAREMQKLNRK